MTGKPEPVGVIREKLDSPDTRTRVVALRHAESHGPAARELIPRILSLYDDPNDGVWRAAVRAFQEVGVGASEAVPILLTLIARVRTGPQHNMSIKSLGRIGPAAHAALPVLLEALRAKPDNSHLLRAIAQIAPDDRAAMDMVLERAFMPVFKDSIGAREILRKMEGHVIDLAFDRIEAYAASKDATIREAHSRVLAGISAKRPDRALPLVMRFVADPTAPGAFLGISTLPRPLPDPVVDALINAVGQGEGHVATTALRVLEMIGAPIRAQAVLLETIRSNIHSPPIAGEQGWPAGNLVDAATILARDCPTPAAVEPLIAWLSAVPDLQPPASADRSWTPASNVAKALSRLAPDSPAVRSAILAVVKASRVDVVSLPSNVLDFDRGIGEAIALLDNPEEMIAKAEALGMARVDPLTDEDEPPDELPAFPTAEEIARGSEPRPVPVAFDQESRQQIAGLVARGLRHLGLAPDAKPQAVAEGINSWLTRCRHGKLSASGEEPLQIGAAFGDAIRRATGWEWRLYVVDGDWSISLASADEAFEHFPIDYVMQQLEPRQEITALAVFNMLSASIFPPRHPGALRRIG